MPNGKKKKGHKMATHKRKKRLRKNRHKTIETEKRNVWKECNRQKVQSRSAPFYLRVKK